MNVFGFFRILLVSLLLLNGAAFASSDPGGDFILTDHNGQPFNLRDYRGKVVLLFFGYTFCPDVCPAELATISSILNKLKNYNDQVLGYNNKIQMFPSNIVAGSFNFKAEEFFEIEDEAEREVPKVSFS